MSSTARSRDLYPANHGSPLSLRPIVFGLSKLVFLSLSQLPYVVGAPLDVFLQSKRDGDSEEPKDPDDPSLWIYLGTAMALVLLGGAFAGLTIALMGQDEIYLQVIASSGEGAERKNATRVLRLLKRGKHWVLVTLLLSNVITNETLPIVLDRSLGGGWPAVLSSTVLIVIFGEIAPQSVCVRYGLPIGAWCSPFVLCLMWIMAPVAWPTAKLLDKLLGKDHGTTYKKAGLKTLVTLHKTLGTSPDERLNQDEVTIISAVLDLKDKPVGSVMTPMNDVFTMSADTILDESVMDTILSAGYSRIPIYAPENPRNFVGMLLVKMLITYDPEDALRVRDFALATLPETRPETSCLDIVNFFQEGKSHMVLVSDFPGESFGALGVVTLEDVIEELIGEEIIDESDVFIDVHKAIRRLAPAPRTRVPKGEILADPTSQDDIDALKPDDKNGVPISRKLSAEQKAVRRSSMDELGTSPRNTTFYMRRSSGNAPGVKLDVDGIRPVAFRHHTSEIMQHLKHLGPSNAANHPRQTKINSVKIKPGVDPSIPTIPENRPIRTSQSEAPSRPAIMNSQSAPRGGIGEGLLAHGGREASDGVYALAQGYGTLGTSPHSVRASSSQRDDSSRPKSSGSRGGAHHYGVVVEGGYDADGMTTNKIIIDHRPKSREGGSGDGDKDKDSDDTVGSLPSARSFSPPRKRQTARSGSITENFVDTGGVKKMVLETTSSSDAEERDNKKDEDDEDEDGKAGGASSSQKGGDAKKGAKKKRKKRAAKNKKKGGEHGDGDESKPLLGGR